MTRRMPTGGPLARAIADVIRERQFDAGMSNRQLAARMDVSHPYIGDRFAYRKDFTLDDIANAADVFGLSPEDLLMEALIRQISMETE